MNETQDTNMIRTMRVARVVMWSIPIALFLWLANIYFVPSGTLRIVETPRKDSPYLENFASKERDVIVGYDRNTPDEPYQVVTTSPLYFTVKTPRPFSSATIDLVYQNPNNHPLIRLGVHQDNDKFWFRDAAVYESRFEELPDEWERLEQGEIVLWQKNRQYFVEKQERERRIRNEEKLVDARFDVTIEDLKRQFDENAITNEQFIKEVAYLEERKEQEKASLHEREAASRPPLPYGSVQAFLAHPPEASRVASWNYELTQNLLLEDYQPLQTMQTLDKGLRGPHEIVTYVGKDETLFFRFTIQNINRHAKRDSYSIEVRNFRDVVLTETITEFGSADPSDFPSTEKVITVERSGLPEGVYTVKIITHDDVFTKRIETKQRYLMFAGKVYVTENEEYRVIFPDKVFTPTTIFTTSTTLTMSTPHDKGRQTVTVGGKNLRLSETQKDYSAQQLSETTTIRLPLNDIFLRGNNYFAFQKEQFLPGTGIVEKITETTNLNAFDFIIARYPHPQENNAWLTTTVSVDRNHLDYSGNQVQMMFDMPGLAEHHRQIRIREIRITLTKPAVTLSSIPGRFQRMFRRIF